ARHALFPSEDGVLFDAGGGHRLTLSSTTALALEPGGAARARVGLAAGQAVVLSLNWGDDLPEPFRRVTVEEADDLLADTVEYWRDWSARCTYHGQWEERVRRSALALKLLTY